jgi:hypothetical protein
MNRSVHKSFAYGLVAWFTVVVTELIAQTNQVDFEQWFLKVPAVDLPAYVARIVELEPAEKRVDITVRSVSAAISVRPGAAPAVVGAVAAVDPEMAPVAAEVAARKQKKLVPVIARAAVGAAPAQCRKIVANVCKVAPEQFKAVACAVADLKPEKANEILDGVCDAFPELAPYIQEVVAEYRGVTPSVRLVIEKALARLMEGKEKPPANSVFLKPLAEWPFEPAVRIRGRTPYGGVDYSRP